MKRILDIFIAIISILILSPFFMLLPILIKITSSGPVFFSQIRVGKDKKPFKIYKFRSMRLHRSSEAAGRIKHNHAVVTRIGYFMRRTKLDEIPQFFNVLLGDMSVVGPRPCLFETIETMSESEFRRFRMLPGITGWAEVNGNVELSWEEQLSLDLWYVDHYHWLLDFQIMFRTFFTVLLGSIKNQRALAKSKGNL